jgi:molybdopterin molybdotransferase
MTSLVSVEACLAQALNDLPPVPPETVALSAAAGHVLAGDLFLPHDLPREMQALRAGLAVTALDLTGASAALPQPLSAPLRVVPGDSLPPGADAVLPEDGVEHTGAGAEAVRPVGPGEGVRRVGHDGRAGDRIARAGERLTDRAALVAALAGIGAVPLRRPWVQVAPMDPALADFAARWVQGLGALLVTEAPDLLLRKAGSHLPRLALSPGDTAWLRREGRGLVIDLPHRFDAMVAALLALGLPALVALSGAVPRQNTRPLTRKVSSGLGLSELVLLHDDADGWGPAAPGNITLQSLSQASAFALLPPDSEGLPAGALLAGVPLDQPFG